MKTRQDISIGDSITFLVDGDGEEIKGVVVATNVEECDGVSTASWDEPTHIVVPENGGTWGVHPSWITEVRGTRTYTITVTFTADRPLTDGELADLTNTVAVQVEEPWATNEDGEWTDATYSTTDVATAHTAI